MNFYIHHPGKAGEVFMALPMAKLLKKYHPESRITWVVLDLYRDSVGSYPYIDNIETIPTYSCRSLTDVAGHMSKHRWYVCRANRWVEDHTGIHIDAYYNYMLYRIEKNRFRLHRDPFYVQLFKNAVHFCDGAHDITSWTPPEWYPTEQAIADGESFERLYGGGPVIIFSPHIADRSCVSDNQSNFDMEFIYEHLEKLNRPVIATGTRWDTKDVPSWVIDGYSPNLSLGGLFYLIQNRAVLVVTPNSGIGFAAHWLGAPVLMIDNRTGWKDQVQAWKKKVPILDDQAQPHERRWPPFMKETFPAQHLSPVPFEQIEWSHDGFEQAITRVALATAEPHMHSSAVPHLHRAANGRRVLLDNPRTNHKSETHETMRMPELHSMHEDEELRLPGLPRLLLFDITRRGDGTATGNVKATLFAGWPEECLAQFYSLGRDGIGVDGAVSTLVYNQDTLSAESISHLARAFAPDVILYRPVPNNLALHEAAMGVIRSANIPLAVWMMDDWPSRLAAEDPQLFDRLDSDLRELLARADLRLSICDAMSVAFAKRYHVSFKAFANGIDPRDWPLRDPGNAKRNTFVLRYAGGLAHNMGLDSVRRVAQAVERLTDNGVDIRFEILTHSHWKTRAKREFRKFSKTSFGEFRPDTAYREWLSQADALLIAYNFDDESKNYTRYSLANKLPECLASGAALLAYGPSDVATIDYIKSLDCAVVVTDVNEEALVSAFKGLVDDPVRRYNLSEKARTVAFDAHNVHRIRRALYAEFRAIAAQRERSDDWNTPSESIKVDHLHVPCAAERRLMSDVSHTLSETYEAVEVTGHVGRPNADVAPSEAAREGSGHEIPIAQEATNAQVGIARDQDPTGKIGITRLIPNAGWYRQLTEKLTERHALLRPFFRFVEWSVGAIARHWPGVSGALAVIASLLGTAFWLAPGLWPYWLAAFSLLTAGGIAFLAIGYGQHFFSCYAARQADELEHRSAEIWRLQRDIGRLRSEIVCAVAAHPDELKRDLVSVQAAVHATDRALADVRAQIADTLDAVRSRQDALDRTVAAHADEFKRDLASVQAAVHATDRALADVRTQGAADKTLAAEVVDAVRNQDAAFRKLNSSNASLARPFNRFLSPEHIQRLTQYWSKVFGVTMSPSVISYLAHRMCVAEDQCEGRLACSIETAMLRQYALRSLKGDRLDVLEIGALFGLGSAFLYKFAGPEQSGIRLTLIDPLEGYYGNNLLDPIAGIPVDRRTLESNYATLHIPKENWRLIQRLSTDPVAAQEAADRQYDLILIDGDHSAAGVARDYEMYAPMIKPGGLIMFDDYGSGHWPSIQPFVDDYVQPDGRWMWIGAEWNTAILRRRHEEGYVHTD